MTYDLSIYPRPQPDSENPEHSGAVWSSGVSVSNPTMLSINRVARSGDFSPKNVTNFGYFPHQFEKLLAYSSPNCRSMGYSSAKILILAFFGSFWLLLGTQAGSSECWTWATCLFSITTE